MEESFSAEIHLTKTMAAKESECMGFLAMIVLGALAGWIASTIMRSSNGLLMDVILGIVGAVAGGFIMSFFGQPGVTGFDVYSLIVAVVGAIVLIWIGRLVTRSGGRTTY